MYIYTHYTHENVYIYIYVYTHIHMHAYIHVCTIQTNANSISIKRLDGLNCNPDRQLRLAASSSILTFSCTSKLLRTQDALSRLSSDLLHIMGGHRMCIHVYIYIYIFVQMHMNIYIYMHMLTPPSTHKNALVAYLSMTVFEATTAKSKNPNLFARFRRCEKFWIFGFLDVCILVP